MAKCTKHYKTLASAKSDETIVSPNVSYISDSSVDKLLMLDTGTDGTPLEIVEVGSDVIIRKKQQKPEMVDLGAIVKWAKTNIGAENEQDAGKYYAWGDVNGYYSSELGGKFTHGWYNDTAASLIEDDLTSENDAATKAFGDGYRMPTREEWEDLLDNVDSSIETVGGVRGLRFTGNGNSIFIPFVGNAKEGQIVNSSDARLYGSTYKSGVYANCTMLYGSGGRPHINYIDRYCGCSIRPVAEK